MNSTSALQASRAPVLALLADDQRQPELLDLLRRWSDELDGATLLATRDTGNLIRSRLGVDVALVESGARGGALQMAALAVEGVVAAVVALHAPSLKPEENAGTFSLRQACDIHNIAYASSLATAEAILSNLLRHAGKLDCSIDSCQCAVPDGETISSVTS